jgi:hypothetical protein
MSSSDLHELVRFLFQRKRVSEKSSMPTVNCDIAIPAALCKPKMTVSVSSLSTVSSTPNVIIREDLERIDRGSEVRTTLMIKRIPRKYTMDLLRDEINGVLGDRGLYDLLYLPVDSAKMTNRGYAFINFIDTQGVETFVRLFSGREWEDLNKRNKTALVCWANVQGRDATLAHIKTDIGSLNTNSTL